MHTVASAFGIVIDDDQELGADDDQVYHLWPENVVAWQCWRAIQTQWRVGMSGPTGLDYQGVSAFLDRQRMERDEACEVFQLLQACELVTLEVWSEQRERQGRERR